MRNYYFLAALMSAAVCLTGCNDDEIMNQPVPQAGDEIVFGASGKFEITEGDSDAKSRTIYGEKVQGENGAGYQAINWVTGDKVMIYSPDVKNVSTYVEYKVTPTGETDKISHGTLTKVDPDAAGLQWSGEQKHTFYAVYPGVSMLDANYKKEFSFNGSVLTGYIPTTQGHRIQKTNYGYAASCNMNYAHMIAKTVTTPAASADGVDLDFYPVVTAVDITLIAKSDVTLSSMNVRGISSDPNPVISGKYSVNITDLKGSTVPDCDLTNDNSLDLNLITVPLLENYDGSSMIPESNRKPIQLAKGQKITLTVFLLPYKNLTGLSVSVSALNEAAKEADLTMTITPHKKSIVNLHLPTSFAGTNDWITSLPDGVYISQLSIPGTANSFSGNKSGNYADENQRTQTATIQEQWAAGIRCFELRSDASKSDNLADVNLQCNRQDVGVTFGEAVGQILDCLNQNPGEFVMIMPAYDGGHGTDGSGAKGYAADLNNFYTRTLPSLISSHLTAEFQDEEGNSFGKEVVTYNPNLTVGDVRGDILFIARITSEEDPEDAVTTLKEGVNIAQWGSLKDYWGRRGYQVNGVRAENWDLDHSRGSSVEYYMMNNNTSNDGSHNVGDFYLNASAPSGYTYNVTVPQKEQVDDNNTDLSKWASIVDYEHTSYRAEGGNTGKAFIQDWARVVPASAAGDYYLGYRNRTNYWCYWGESYSEKQADVWNTFKLCMQEHGGKVGNRFFVNSLDGYYVTSTIPLSYFPYIQDNRPDINTGGVVSAFGQGGVEGDIASFANDINRWFYGRLLGIGFNNMTGPVNIMILDRVLSGEGTSGELLPQVIIDNNFKFPLMTRNGGTPITQSKADGSYASGGTVWH